MDKAPFLQKIDRSKENKMSLLALVKTMVGSAGFEPATFAV